jgi:hypothetical protein
LTTLIESSLTLLLGTLFYRLLVDLHHNLPMPNSFKSIKSKSKSKSNKSEAI